MRLILRPLSTDVNHQTSGYAHRHELTLGFSAEDDIPDPFVLGEVPEREWTVPSGRSSPRSRKSERLTTRLRGNAPKPKPIAKQTATRARRKAKPQPVNQAKSQPVKPPKFQSVDQAKARLVSQKKSVANNGRRSRVGGRRRRTQVSWHTFALDWLRRHPGASNRQWQEAIEEAGHLGVTAAGVSALRATAKPMRSRAPSAMVTRTAQKVQPSVSRVCRCDACDLVVGDDGRCRC